MALFKPSDWWDRFFAIGIIAKGLDGALELIGGVLLLFVTPAAIHGLVATLTQHELSENPHDFIATHLLHSTDNLTGGSVLFGAMYLIIHGLVKVILVMALLQNKFWAYPWMIAVLLAFIIYQAYKIALAPTLGLIALTLFDALIVALTWHEYLRQRRQRPNKRTSGSTPLPAL